MIINGLFVYIERGPLMQNLGNPLSKIYNASFRCLASGDVKVVLTSFSMLAQSLSEGEKT